jgi:hypothetical protein
MTGRRACSTSWGTWPHLICTALPTARG